MGRLLHITAKQLPSHRPHQKTTLTIIRTEAINHIYTLKKIYSGKADFTCIRSTTKMWMWKAELRLFIYHM